MPLQIIHSDITEIRCDAVVNPTDRFYSGGGGTDLAIHNAAGPELFAACGSLKPLECGEVEVTEGFNMQCRYILHTTGPVWNGGYYNEAVLLRSCYMNSLIKARELKLESVAFPLISSGAFGFPKKQVLRIAVKAISDFLLTMNDELQVYICVINRESYELSRSLDLEEYLDSHLEKITHNERASLLVELEPEDTVPDMEMPMLSCPPPSYYADVIRAEAAPALNRKAASAGALPLEKWIKQQDDSFALLLFKLIDKKGMDDVECYKKANVSKNTFSKIKNSATYKPSKPTVLAFAIALRLSLEETDALLKSAGFALSRNNKFDLIIEYYITNGIYDIFEINEALYKYDQVCLGC